MLRHCNSISGLSRPLPHPYCSPCYSAAALSGLQVHKITVFATTPASHPPFLQTTAKFTSLKNVILCRSYHTCLRNHKSAIKPSIDQLPDPEHEHHSGSILNVRTEVDFRPWWVWPRSWPRLNDYAILSQNSEFLKHLQCLVSYVGINRQLCRLPIHRKVRLTNLMLSDEEPCLGLNSVCDLLQVGGVMPFHA